MFMPGNFLGLMGVLDTIEQGTLMALNNSLGFYHEHMMIQGNRLRTESDPDMVLINPIEDFDGTFGFPAHHQFYLMGAESPLFGLDYVSFPFGDPMTGLYDPDGRKIAFGGGYVDKGPDEVYHVSTGYRDICAQLGRLGVPPGYETVISQLEYHFTGRREVDDAPTDDDGNDMIIRFPTG